jgi:hypothetical protein
MQRSESIHTENCFRKADLCLDTSEVQLQEESIILDADWKQMNSGSTFSAFVELRAELVT